MSASMCNAIRATRTFFIVRRKRKEKQQFIGIVSIISLVVALVAYGYFVLKPVLVETSPQTLMMLKIVCQPCGLMALWLLRLCHTKDPGLVKNLHSRGEHLSECEVCHEMRPLGSHHCRICDACVVGFDHHCGALGVCVARGNRLTFVALLGVGCAATIQLLGATMMCAAQEWELRLACGADCGWFYIRLMLRYLPALFLLIHVAIGLGSFFVFQLCLLAFGTTMRSVTQRKNGAKYSMQKGSQIFKSCCSRLCTAMSLCMPASVVHSTNRLFDKLHTVGGKCPAWKSSRLRFGSLVTFLVLMTSQNVILILRSDLPWRKVGVAVQLVGAVGCLLFGTAVNFSRSHLQNMLIFAPCDLEPEANRVGNAMHCNATEISSIESDPGPIYEASSPNHGIDCFRIRSDLAQQHCFNSKRDTKFLCADRPEESGVLSETRQIIDTYPTWCTICRAKSEPLMVHCKVCKLCVPRRDHHCGLFGVCIGSHNRRSYVILLCFACIAPLPQGLVGLSSHIKTVAHILENNGDQHFLWFRPEDNRPLDHELLINMISGFGYVCYNLFMCQLSIVSLFFLMQQATYAVYAAELVSLQVGRRVFKSCGLRHWGKLRCQRFAVDRTCGSTVNGCKERSEEEFAELLVDVRN